MLITYKRKGYQMNKEDTYKLIKSIENKQAIEHQLEQISQLVDKLEKHLEERGII
tara:strand:- start:176 stop:340 length:165 start_codon:yes stop_codon:yes gene_type:complete